jgi:threonine/homoserine/homoserine lactone efflux protein
MTDFVFLQGMLGGLALAIPVGPVGLLCIRRALADGRFAAFVAGTGAALADTIYGAMAVLGLSLISDFILQHTTELSVLGSLFLIYLGIKTVRTRPIMSPTPAQHIGLWKDFFSTFIITLTNPGTIFAFVGVFAAKGSIQKDFTLDSGIMVLGIFAGSCLWWFILSAIAGSVRSRFTPKWLVWLNWFSGGILLFFAAALLAAVVFDFDLFGRSSGFF